MKPISPPSVLLVLLIAVLVGYLLTECFPSGWVLSDGIQAGTENNNNNSNTHNNSKNHTTSTNNNNNNNTNNNNKTNTTTTNNNNINNNNSNNKNNNESRSRIPPNSSVLVLTSWKFCSLANQFLSQPQLKLNSNHTNSMSAIPQLLSQPQLNLNSPQKLGVTWKWL